MQAGALSPASSCGPVAQLGARLNGIEEVRGSNPRRSTKLSLDKKGPSNMDGPFCVSCVAIADEGGGSHGHQRSP